MQPDSLFSPSQSPMTRRGVLGTLGVAGITLLASSLPASAFFTPKPSSGSVDFNELPADWVARQGSTLRDYATFLDSLKLSRVTAHQVIDAHAKQHGTVWNCLPPKAYWKSMVPTLRVIDRLGAELGMPVDEIVSAYRCPAYNARCPGAKSNSYHQSNVAVDVRFKLRPGQVTRAARVLRGQGYFRGGIGGYGSFTHIDTRGVNVDW